MKRSEMVNKLAEAIRLSQFSLTSEKMAEYLLQIVEKEGMLPPCSANFDGHLKENWKINYCNRLACDDYIESCHFEWEEE